MPPSIRPRSKEGAADLRLAPPAVLIDAMRATRLFIPTIFTVLYGLRRSEISALRWRHVDRGPGQLAVVGSVEQASGSTRLKETKSGHARTLALSATMTEELKAHSFGRQRSC
jgi:integrase